MFNEYNEILTVTDIMEILFIGKNTAYDLLNSGELEGFRIGHTWKIPRQKLTNYIESKYTNT